MTVNVVDKGGVHISEANFYRELVEDYIAANDFDSAKVVLNITQAYADELSDLTQERTTAHGRFGVLATDLLASRIEAYAEELADKPEIIALTKADSLIEDQLTEAKAELAKNAGADTVINYTQQDFEDEVKKATGDDGLRIIFDAVGLTTFAKGLNCLGRRGYMALYGAASGPVPPIDSGALRNRSLFLTRPNLGDYASTRDELLQRADEVLDWVQSGELKLHIGLTLPLSQAAEAHRQLEGRETTGKILLMP